MVQDDATQAAVANRALRSALAVIVGNTCLCECVWVLQKGYKLLPDQIAAAIRLLQNTANVEMNDAAVEAGLAMLEDGGDFADGVIAHEGAMRNGDTFLSFDRQAIRLLKAQGRRAKLLT